ncbi:MAG: DUF2851 family protein [Bacteroidales bacterium]|jgi:hypothetical protein|nr:DUF2851 family protein [Bacteroidales bacterium]
MTEDFLQYLWRFQIWNSPLKTSNGEPVEVINSGFYNTDGGPDFLDARIRIGNTLWAGHVEIHTKSSDWYAHHHEQNSAYNSVILHVVYDNDVSANRSTKCELNGVKRAIGTVIPTCSVQENFSKHVFQTFLNWRNNRGFVPCEKQVQNLSEQKRIMLLERLNIERLEEKVNEILVDLTYNLNSWEETFYQHLLRAFGLRINTEAFHQLAKRTPLKFLQKHANNRFQLEAMLFGQAQLLNSTFNDSYPRALQEEYAFLQQKFGLLPIADGLVNFLRVRPCSFPTLRLAFFASLIQRKSQIFQDILQIQNINDGLNLLNADVSEYWRTHYVFDKLSVEKNKELGQSTQQLIFINTIIPFLFAFGKLRDNPNICDRALGFLQDLPAENNLLIRQWKSCGIPANNASDSQALLTLKKKYCDLKRCLQCGIGIELLKC